MRLCWKLRERALACCITCLLIIELADFVHQVCLVAPAAAEEGRTPLPNSGMLASSMGVDMQPYLEGMSRVALATGKEAAATVLNLLRQAGLEAGGEQAGGEQAPDAK